MVKKTKYFILACDENCELVLYTNADDPHCITALYCDLLNSFDPEIQDVPYTIQFLSISSTLTKSNKHTVCNVIRLAMTLWCYCIKVTKI